MNLETEEVRFVAGGAVQAGGGVYVRRDADEFLYRYCREGEFAYVLTSRQMGKSSLMIHTKDQLEDEGTLCVIMDLTDLGVNTTTADQWYCGFVKVIADQLDLPVEVESWWHDHAYLSFAQRFTSFLQEVVLTNTTQPLVLFVDEIDSTLPLDFTDDFFASIRYLYNARAVNPALRRLSFVLLGVASPGDLIKDRERTPFNIGKRVELHDFKQEDAVQSLGADETLVEEVFRHTGGHPYLTLRVFRSLAEKPLETTVEQRVYSLFLGDESTRDTNLQYVRDCLLVTNLTVREGESKEELRRRKESYETTRERLDKVRQRYHDILRGKRVPNREADPICIALGLSGVVRIEDGLLKVRNSIYRKVFNEAWIAKNKRINWAKRATWGTVAVFTLIVLVAEVTVNSPGFRNFLTAQAIAVRENVEILKLRGQVAALQQDVQNAQETNSYLNQQIKERDAGLSEAQRSIGSQKSKIEEQSQRLDASQKQINTLQSTNNTLLQDKSNLQLVNNSLSATNSELTQQLKDAQNKPDKPVAATKPSPPQQPPPPQKGTLVVNIANPIGTGKKSRDIPGLAVWLDDQSNYYAQVKIGTSLSIRIDEGPHTITLNTRFADKFEPVTTKPVQITRDKKTVVKFVPGLNHVGSYTVTTDGDNESDPAKVAPNQIKK